LKTAAGRSKRPLAIVGIAIESDRSEQVATKLPPATQSEPGLFGSGDHDAGHRPTPLEDGDFLAGLADLINKSKALRLEGAGYDFHELHRT